MRTIIETGLFLSGGFLISILQGLILIPNILLISYKKRLFDQPDERKVHSIPVPRLGGISFFPAILVSLCLIIGLFHCVGIPIARLLTDRSLLEYLVEAGEAPSSPDCPIDSAMPMNKICM